MTILCPVISPLSPFVFPSHTLSQAVLFPFKSGHVSYCKLHIPRAPFCTSILFSLSNFRRCLVKKELFLLFADYFLPVQLKGETAEKNSLTPVIQRSFVAAAQWYCGSHSYLYGRVSRGF